MQSQSIQAEERTQIKKNAARRSRATGQLPGILYGQKKEPTLLSVSTNSLLSALSTDFKRNVLIKLQMKDQEKFVVVKELQIDPVSRDPLHVDFYQVDLETPIEVRVPFITVGQSKGVQAGGELNAVFRVVPILAKPNDIPASIEADITELQIFDLFQVKDLKLPDGVKVLLEPDRTLISIAAERKEIPEETEEALEGAEEKAEEGESAAEAKTEGDGAKSEEGK